jgi:hypothetical protein
MSTFNLANLVKIVNPSSNVDFYYGVWDNVTDAVLNVPQAVRAKGKTVGVLDGTSVVEYWWKDGTEDSDLIEKGVEVDLSEYLTSTQINQLLNNYYTSDQVDTLLESLDLDQLANLEEEVPAQIVAGNINIGDILEEGLSFTDFVKLLLLSTYEPTLISPSYNLATSITGIREVGSTANITLTGQFNRGLIRGDLVSGSWSPNATQDLRAGAASGYSFDGTSQAGDTISFSHVVTEGQNEFESIVTHQIGPQPLNSEGNNFNFPFPAGTIGDNNVQLVGRYRQFFGSVANFPTTSSAIRSLNSNFSNTDRFTVNINTTRFTIVIPDTKDLVNVTTQNNENITGNFSESTISVEDGGGNLVNYKIFNLQTAIPLNVMAEITLS